LPVMNFHDTGSKEAKIAVKMMQRHKQHDWEITKFKANHWAAAAIKTYDDWWSRCIRLQF
jgi:hypothetical protein